MLEFGPQAGRPWECTCVYSFLRSSWLLFAEKSYLVPITGSISPMAERVCEGFLTADLREVTSYLCVLRVTIAGGDIGSSVLGAGGAGRA